MNIEINKAIEIENKQIAYILLAYKKEYNDERFTEFEGSEMFFFTFVLKINIRNYDIHISKILQKIAEKEIESNISQPFETSNCGTDGNYVELDGFYIYNTEYFL